MHIPRAVLGAALLVVGLSILDASPASAAAPPANALDADTATLTGSLGQWVPWFSSSIAQTGGGLQPGGALLVEVTAPYGWGVHLRNYPGFAASPGPQLIGYQVRNQSDRDNPGPVSATMTVVWRDAAANVLASDTVSTWVGFPAQYSSWEQAGRVVTAPPGTAFVDVTFTGRGQPGSPGTPTSQPVGPSRVIIDDIVVVPVTNAVDLDTSTAEGSVGQWIPWFSANPSRTTAEAHTGTASLKVDVTAPYGWGIQLQNYPGFATTPMSSRRPRVISFWAKAGQGTGLGATMTVAWRGRFNEVLDSSTVTLAAAGPMWQQATAVVSAPAGTFTVDVTIAHPSGGPGDSIFLDDIVVADL